MSRKHFVITEPYVPAAEAHQKRDLIVDTPHGVWISLAVFHLGTLINGVLFAGSQTASLTSKLMVSLMVAPISFLFVRGLLRGRALAFQYLKSFAGFSGVLATLAVLTAVLTGATGILSAPFYSLLIVIAAYLPLRNETCRQFFGLTCPKCGSHKAKSGDFLFKKRRCKKCKHTWEQTVTRGSKHTTLYTIAILVGALILDILVAI